MSKKHASPRQSASEPTSGYGPASTLPASHPGTTSTSQTSSRRRSGQTCPYLVNHMKSENIDFSQLFTLSQDYDDSPQSAKQWLTSFNDLRPGSNVSLKLVAVKVIDTAEDNGTSPTYPSMLPVLSKWVRMWFDRAHAARLQKRKKLKNKAKRTLVPEDDDFDWICAYTTDYLKLDHQGLDEEDIVVLIESTLYICSKSGAAVDFDRLLKLLVSVYSRYGCPASVFGKSLYLLCGIRGSFPELPAHFSECLDLILSGPQGAAAVGVLHGFLRADTIELDSSELSTTTNAARGVIQIFQQVIGSEPTAAAVSTGELLSSLLSATTLQSGRVNEALLSLCVTLVERKPSIVDGPNKQFAMFMKIVDAAYWAVKVRKQATEEGPASSVRSSKEMKLEGNGPPTTIRDMVDSVLEGILRSSVGFKRSLVFNHFLAYAGQQSPETSLRVLDYAGKDILREQDHEHWKKVTLQIINMIQSPTVSFDVRLTAIDIVEDALWSPELTWSNRDEGYIGSSEGTTTIDLVQELLTMIKTETNPRILQAVVDTAIRAVITYDAGHFMEQTCSDLAEVIFREPASTEVAQCAEIGARGLVSIFMRSLNTVHVGRTDFAYRKLNEIASSFGVPAEARLAAMRLLFRIRCDSIGRIYISETSDSENLAAALCRTDESAAKFPQTTDSSEEHGSSRSSGSATRRQKPTPPLWIYPGVPALPHVPDRQSSEFVVAPGSEIDVGSERRKPMELELGIWLESIITCLQKDPGWETYSYVIVHTGAQLSNVTLFEGTIRQIQFLRSVFYEQVGTNSFHEPPTATGLKKGDVALCIFNAMTPLIAYKAHFSRNECDALVRAFVAGVGSFEGTSRGCIHSLSICCFEIPASVTKNLSGIVHKIQTNATQSHLSMHFLEFFAGLARLPEVHTNLHGDEIRLIFGICISYIKSMRDRRAQTPVSAGGKAEATATTRLSGVTVPPFRAKILSAIELPQYVSALAYQTMIFWFLSLKLSERAKHVPWIIKSLIAVDNDGNEQMEKQSEVFIDMMQRTAYSDLGETLPRPDFARESDGSVTVASWLVGLSIVTIETAGSTGLSQITKRQASGTTHSLCQQLTAEPPPHHAPLITDIRPETTLPTAILPQHILLQLVTTCAPTSLASQPLPLPDADYVQRALKAFDLNPTVDSNKAGVIYIGPGQSKESEILANTQGSADFDQFLHGLGTKMRLDSAKFNTQGLRSDTDGEYAYAWRDRVTEIVYHVPTMMPTSLEDDPQCTNKKMHIGNDHVNIIFNRSGQVFEFNTFSSQFNYINIVVTPASRIADMGECLPASTITTTVNASSSSTDPNNKHPQFYTVHTLTAPGFPCISPCSDPKIISSANLAGFVRLVALNACVFSLAWRDRDSPSSDHMSSWRNRLQEIRSLRDRVMREAATAAPEPKKGVALYAGYGKAGPGGRPSLYPEGRGELTGEGRRPTVVDYENVNANAEGRKAGGEEKMADLYDFSRWALQ